MSRRDTIIIAVLVNAALLMILFATSSRSKEKESKPENGMLSSAPIAFQEESVKSPAEELEEILSQYVAPSLPQEMATAKESVETFTVPKPIEASPLASVSPQMQQIEELKPAAPETTEFVVKKGDVLEKIAHSHGTTVAAIMNVNHLTSTQLKIGQVLQIPGKKTAVAAKPQPAASTPTAEFYVVKEGDNPWLIASKNRIKLEELLRLNDLDEKKARRLRPGDKLRLR